MSDFRNSGRWSFLLRLDCIYLLLKYIVILIDGAVAKWFYQGMALEFGMWDSLSPLILQKSHQTTISFLYFILSIIVVWSLMALECEIPYHLPYWRSPTRIQSPSFTSDFLASQNKWRVFVKFFWVPREVFFGPAFHVTDMESSAP